MKKFIFAMFVAVATLACFSSCSKDDDDKQAYTFVGEDDVLGTLSITLNLDGQTFVWTEGSKATGTFTYAGNVITMSNEETLVADVDIVAEGWNKVKKVTYNGTVLKKK